MSTAEPGDKISVGMMKNRKTVIAIVVAVILLIGGVAWMVFGMNLTPITSDEAPAVSKKPKPAGVYRDVSTKDDEGGVTGLDVSGGSDTSVLSSKLEKYFKDKKTDTGDKDKVYATYGDYAVGESGGMETIWGPGDDGKIKVIAYSDVEVFSCEDMFLANVPQELLIGPSGVSVCMNGSGDESEYRN